ncbi:MAG: DUF5063 domain-containing protein [Muribaculaceae bacterium]|nr:DUF5063 domain-containing protein [Muribaculaceae bacterium]
MDLKPNTLSLIGLCREYCAAVEGVEATDAREFLATMVRLLPRIYISATDLERQVTISDDEDPTLDNYLEEDYYEALRLKIENLLGPDDVYLEVFEEEMKYSDTPIGASVAEGLCDLFQTFYNFVESVKGSLDSELMASTINAMREEFETTWSQQLVNLMRPLNALIHKNPDDEY